MAKTTNKPAAVKSETQAASAPVVTVTQTVAAATKADKARTIFKEAYGTSPVPQRKDIIHRMVNEAGLTKAGAATYLQNMKTKAGLVVSRAKAAPAVAATSGAPSA
jgi:hypothetical protein